VSTTKAEIVSKADKIEGWFRYEELAVLYELARKYLTKDDLAVEVGSWKGRSSFVLGSVCKEVGAKLICIDTFAGSVKEDQNYKEAEKMGGWDFMEKYIKKNLEGLPVEYMVEISEIAFNSFKDDSIKFCFIDGDHTDPVISQDLNNFWPKVKKGGLFAGHDYDTSCPDVVYALHQKFGMDFDKGVTGSIWFKEK